MNQIFSSLSLLLGLAVFSGPAFSSQDPCTIALTSNEASWAQDYPNLAAEYAKALTLVQAGEVPTLSIVIPAFREEKRIVNSLKQIQEFFNKFPYPVEVLLRVEKSPDRTVEVATEAVAGDTRFVISGHPVQKGKGYAVRQGMLAANGDFVLFMDADLSTPLPEIYHFLSLIAAGTKSPILIGDRHHPQSHIEENQSFKRQLMGATFRALVRRVLSSYGLKGINDTQCGFKMFSKKAAEKLFSLARIDGFAFDIEVLLMASEMGMKIESVPILWRDDARSTVHPILDPLKMLRDVIKISRQVKSNLSPLSPLEPM